MNILDISNQTIEEIHNIPNHSQLCIVHNNIDLLQDKPTAFDTIISKLRIGGEFILFFTDVSALLSDCQNNIISKQDFCNNMQNVKYYTDYNELSYYIMNLEPNISLYKHVRENYKIIISLVRKQY
jgi:hypothetical protein